MRLPLLILCTFILFPVGAEDILKSDSLVQKDSLVIEISTDSTQVSPKEEVLSNTLDSDTMVVIDSLTSEESLSIDTLVRDSGVARLILTSEIDSVLVELNGITLGKTPLIIDTLLADDYIIVCKKKGYYGKKIGITLKADTTTEVAITLRAPASLMITSTPDSATILINKKRVGITPFKAYPLRPDSYDILLLKEGFANIDTTVMLNSGAQDSLSTILISTTILDTAVTEKMNENQVDLGIQEKKKRKAIAITASSLLAVVVSMIFVFEAQGTK